MFSFLRSQNFVESHNVLVSTRKPYFSCSYFHQKFTRFTSLLEGCGLVGQVSQQCITSGQDLYCLYRGFDTIIGALGHLVGRGEKVVILSKHRPSSLQQPLIKDLKSRALLSAMNNLAGKTGHKILLSKTKLCWGDIWLLFRGEWGGTGHRFALSLLL